MLAYPVVDGASVCWFIYYGWTFPCSLRFFFFLRYRSPTPGAHVCAHFRPAATDCQSQTWSKMGGGKSSIIIYHVDREEPDLKAHNLYRLSLLRRRVLKFHQNGLSFLRRIWTTAATGHGEVPIDVPFKYGPCSSWTSRFLNCSSNNRPHSKFFLLAVRM